MGEIWVKEKDMEWQPIETASAKGKRRLLFKVRSGQIISGYRIANSDSVVAEFSRHTLRATHWMPLPAPPKGEKNV